MPKLVLSSLERKYGSVVAVERIDLTLEGGEFVSLLGPSGCGKTTTLRMIAGFITPTAGRIEMDGKVLSTPESALPPEHRRMSMIFQSYAIWPNMTVAENVAFGLKLRKLPRAEVETRTRKILEVVQMARLADRYPAELSGGQQQRVALARAIVVEPEVLLLDEPLSNLDANLREEMRFEIRRLHDEFKITTVYVTHDQAEAMVTSDRIVVMNLGRVEQVDAPYALYTKPRSRFVAGFIGRTNFIDVERRGADLVLRGGAVPAGPLPDAPASGPATLSIRPQNIGLSRTQPNSGHWALAGEVVDRAYLGEHWDYHVRIGQDGATLRVSVPPAMVHAVHDKVWLDIDPAQVVVLR